MRILHLIRSANPAGGGPIEAVTRLALEHERHGRRVEVVTLDDPRAPWWRTFPLPFHALGPVGTKYRVHTALVPWLLENGRRFDLVVVNGIWQYTSFAAWRASRRHSVPYVVFTHGMLDPWFKRRYPLKHAKKWLYWPWAEYRVLRDATAVLFTSEEEMALAASRSGCIGATSWSSTTERRRRPTDDGATARAVSERVSVRRRQAHHPVPRPDPREEGLRPAVARSDRCCRRSGECTFVPSRALPDPLDPATVARWSG